MMGAVKRCAYPNLRGDIAAMTAGHDVNRSGIPSPAARNFTRLRWWVHARRHPSAFLLFAQLAALVLYPFIEDMHASRAALGASGALVLGLTIWMVHRTPGRAWISAGLALPAVVLTTLELSFGWQHLLAWSAALEALFYFYAVVCLIAYMTADRRATTDELFAAGATFTLLVWAFTYVFVVCQALQPGSFTAAVEPDAPRRWSELLYLSFALLSSTGIGDIMPVTVHARSLASLEMFSGVMYLALVVSRLIGLTLAAREK